jgi:hypothetical protein
MRIGSYYVRKQARLSVVVIAATPINQLVAARPALFPNEGHRRPTGCTADNPREQIGFIAPAGLHITQKTFPKEYWLATSSVFEARRQALAFFFLASAQSVL